MAYKCHVLTTSIIPTAYKYWGNYIAAFALSHSFVVEEQKVISFNEISVTRPQQVI